MIPDSSIPVGVEVHHSVNKPADEQAGCDKCDNCGGVKTYANQACLPINGKVRCIDWCIHQTVAALNAGGVNTAGSCCGHGVQDGLITLEDGRELIIKTPPPQGRIK